MANEFKIKNGAIVQKLKPLSDSTTALQINTAGDTATILNIDSTNKRIGLNNIAPAFTLDVYGNHRVTGTTSGDTVLDIQGTQGQLFSVTDSLTGDLFKVSDITGIPIFSINSSGAIKVDGDLILDATTVTATNGDYLIISDTSNGDKLTRGIGIGTDTGTYLRNDGTWATPPNTTYSASTGLNLSATTFSVIYGTTAGSAAQGNDSRLSDARTPLSHTHGNITNDGKIGTTANLMVRTTTAGTLTTLAAGTTSQFLRGDGAWATPPQGTVTSVSGTGSYGGLTLTGTVTSSGNLTLGGTPTGTWPISVTGNAGTVTNGVYTTSSYSDPSWLTISKSKVGLADVENTKLSTWAGSTSITTLGTISTGTVPWARLSGVPSSFTPSSHNHGSLNDDGTIGGNLVGATNGDYILIADESDSGRLQPSIAIGTSTTTYLRNDGTWSTPPQGTVTSVSGTGSYGGLTLTGTVTSSGNLTLGGTPTGTWPISVTGNAGTVTNGVYTTSSYSDPSWLTISKSKVGLGSVENTALSNWVGSTSITTLGTISTGTVPWARLSGVPSSFTPSSHTHGNITNDGKIGATANLIVTTTTNGVLTTLSAGTTSQYLRGDGTWSTPPNTTYSASTGLNLSSTTFSVIYGTTAGSAAQGNDSRLSDARTPLSHNHGNINNDGTIVGNSVGATNGDYILIADASDSARLQPGIGIGTGTTTYLRNDGTWSTPPQGTVTSVSGTGGYGGLTLTGTVTSSGNLTLGGTPTGVWPISVSGNAATVTNGLYTGTSFGGDVSGTYNAIVVADNSHNHTSSNISDATNTNTGNVIVKRDGSGNFATNGIMLSSHSSGGYISGGLIKDSIIDLHPEGSTTVLPFISNDIAYLTLRGGAVTSNIGTIPLQVFDGSPSYAFWDNTNWATAYPTGVTIEIQFHKTFYYGTKVGISFGATNWRAKDIKIETYDPITLTWTIKGNVTNYEYSYYQVNGDIIGANGISKLRFTLKNFNSYGSTNFRIAQIWLLNYSSLLSKEVFLGRDGGDMYGSFQPFVDNTYNIGTLSKKWANIYATNFIGNLTGNADSADYADVAGSVTNAITFSSGGGASPGITYNGSGARTIDYSTVGAASSDHVHGSINSNGTITATAITPANTDYILLSDTSNSGKIERGIAIGTGTTTYLRNDGTWSTPSDTNTTYTFASGTTNGSFEVKPSTGSTQSVSIFGLGTNAYNSTAFLPLTGGTVSGLTRFDTNVGIGTTAADVRLKVFEGGTADYQMRIGGGDGFSYDIGRNTTTGLLTFYGRQGGTNGYSFTGVNGERMRIDTSGNVTILGNVGIGLSASTYKLQVLGSFAATTKSFIIDHPTKSDSYLRYGSLEGPENGVYIRGRLVDSNTIKLPDYWVGLVDADTITVNLTPFGSKQSLWVKSIQDNKITIGHNKFKPINCFYTIYGERKDVDKLQVEIKK